MRGRGFPHGSARGARSASYIEPMVRRCLVALTTVFATVYACGGDDDYREACASVALGGSLCDAHEVLRPAGGRYAGYIEGEHRYARDLDWCALTVDEEGEVMRVRYVEPSRSWSAP